MLELEKIARLKEIHTKISELRAQILELETEESNLANEISDVENHTLNQLPARAKNSLIRYGIDSDLKLHYFLHGNSQSIDTTWIGFNERFYSLSTTFLGRLMSLPNIGVGTAQAVIKILEQNEFL